MGRIFLGAGAVFGLVALAIGPPIVVLALLVFFGTFWGAFMYLLVVRRITRAAAAGATVALPTSRRESAEETRHRLVRQMAFQLIALGVFVAVFPTLQIHHHAVAFAPAFAGGAALSMGVAMLASRRWLRGWEDEHFRLPTARATL